MVYVNSRGQVVAGSAVHWSRPISSFWVILAFVLSFFRSLFAPFQSMMGGNSSGSSGRASGSSGGSFGGFGGGGGGGGGSSGYRRGPGGPPKPRGGFKSTSDILPPPMPGGCGCG